MDQKAIQPPHSANRHDAGCRGAGGGRRYVTMTRGVKPMKLNKRQVLNIRTSYKNSNASITELARKYNVSPTTIFNVVKSYTHKTSRYVPPATKQPFDSEYAKYLRRKGRTYRAISILEAKKHNRAKGY
jgi:hypothetical protein